MPDSNNKELVRLLSIYKISKVKAAEQLGINDRLILRYCKNANDKQFAAFPGALLQQFKILNERVGDAMEIENPALEWDMLNRKNL